MIIIPYHTIPRYHTDRLSRGMVFVSWLLLFLFGEIDYDQLNHHIQNTVGLMPD